MAAVERLKAAVAERKHAGDQSEASKGTSRDVHAAASVKAADEEISARKRWLSWVDDSEKE